ncbi:FAD-dependent oxidoreductase [Enterococcus saccharolyticus]|uniref:Pyridine nucleotide-disulfide oxidoreductase n=1 Tax=Candidatus Enterococcus willemsii TaxID=1857215 RepID=A0ABQ6Z2I2_9ENTE|nr:MULTISPECIES: FAD-dependent oxidoreductase [Enterococcus]KAF1306002.1 pyridine nucleotide-disulfide oxidoreductase [Enterococcus sp. CU12B]MCD5003248.1 FAD-dependent oxidoreductase [Enterococcus saccharolyticus]
MRVIIIGGSHAGIAAARHLKKIDDMVEVIIIEQSNVLGYIGSSLNLYLEGFIDKLEDARTVTASQLLSEQINVLLNTRVVAIDEKERTIDFMTLVEGDTVDSMGYDYLILAMGSSQYSTDFSASAEETITNFKTLTQSKEALETLTQANSVAIIGAGLIGFELAESLSRLGKEIFLIDRMDSILFRYFDEEISDVLMQKIPENVHVLLNSNVQEIEEQEQKKISLANGQELVVDEAFYAINPRPNCELVSDCLEINMDGTIVTNEYLETSDPFIYAVGDLVSVHFNHSAMPIYIPLVTNAYRTGMIAASNILLNEKIPFPKVQRTIVSELFDTYLASCGINEEEAPYYGFNVSSVTKSYHRKALFDDEPFELTLKLVYDVDSKQLMGGQLMSSSKHSLEIINTLSALVTMEATLHQLVTMDFYFNPKLSMPLHFLNDLAMKGVINQE